MMRSNLRYLWAYSAAHERASAWHQRLLVRRRELGYDIKGFCVTPAALNHRWLPFPELDQRWKSGDRKLLTLYEQLARQLEDRDVLILYNGANLHPEFVRWLNLVKVYTCGDDPESSEILSRPVAPAFDIHLVNNIACVQMYRDWGLRNVHFWPLGSQVFEEDVSDLDEAAILQVARRPLPAVFFGEIDAPWRKERLMRLATAFPDAWCAGRGWQRGFVDWSQVWQTYRQAQIGWNVHNSSGPINFRTYDLPAHGVLQICDNRSTLGDIFELDKEVIGFETIDECIDLTRYYLAHPQEQREIALAGWKRWKQSYTPDQVWARLVDIVEGYQQAAAPPVPVAEVSRSAQTNLQTQRRKTTFRYAVYWLKNLLRPVVNLIRNYARRSPAGG
jgi:spore maturation protein CgeB